MNTFNIDQMVADASGGVTLGSYEIKKIADLQNERDQLLAVVATDTTALCVLQREHAELQHIAIQVAEERDVLRASLKRIIDDCNYTLSLLGSNKS